MKSSAAFLRIALVFGAIALPPWASARAQGPIEIEQCQTISHPGSYKLVNNLSAPIGADCLDITVSFVTIDLGGFTIDGHNLSLGAIRAMPPSGGEVVGVAVRNGSISGFSFGVGLGSDSIVEVLRVVGEGIFGSFGISATGIVRGNTVRFIGTGPGGPGRGISATGIVTGNFVSENGHGMEIGAGSTVIGNTALGNRVDGITVDCPSNVTDNTAVANGNGGPNLILNGHGCNNTNNVAP
jgi:hypothetical protein